MPSDTHKTLLRKLQDTDVLVRDAFLKEDEAALNQLLQAQRSVRSNLEAAGPCRDEKLLALLMETRGQLSETAKKIESRLENLANRLRAAGVKRKLTDAYRKPR